MLKRLQLIRTVLSLPVAQLRFERSLEPDHVLATYRYYTKRHPRYKIIQHKSWGAALLDLQQCAKVEHYLERIKGKNCGAYHARRAKNRGYTVREIDRNDYIDDIHDINVSLEQRQGRPMDATYRARKQAFDTPAHLRAFGVLRPDGKLMAYATLGHLGNFSAFSQLIGHRNNDGIMHLLVVEIVTLLIQEARVQYLMYDTFFGALPGMQQFKTILGFTPYRAHYTLL